MLAQRLKDSTHRPHQELEKKLISVIRAIKSLDEYADLLRLMYGFYAVIEQKIQQHVADHILVDYAERRKSAVLIEELELLGRWKDVKLCDSTPDISSSAKALGALYVLEGSTLGGAIIARMINNQLNEASPRDFRFFNCYGDQTQAMWSSFKRNLDRPYNAEEQDEIIDGANETFSTFKIWIDHYAAN